MIFSDCKNDSKIISDNLLLWNFYLDQGFVVAAYVIDGNNEIVELAAVNFMYLISDVTEKDISILEV